LFLATLVNFKLVFYEVGGLVGWVRLGEIDVRYFRRLGLVALVVIALGLEIPLTLIPSFYIAYFNIHHTNAEQSFPSSTHSMEI